MMSRLCSASGSRTRVADKGTPNQEIGQTAESEKVPHQPPSQSLGILESFKSWCCLSSSRKPSRTSPMCALNLWGARLDSKTPEDKVSTSDFLLPFREIATIHVRISWPVLQFL